MHPICRSVGPGWRAQRLTEREGESVARRLEMERLREMLRLRRMGTSTREIARLLSMGANTERRYRLALARAGIHDGAPDALPDLETLKVAVTRQLPAKPVPQHRSSIEDWRSKVEALFDKGLSARATFDRLRLEAASADPPFRGSCSAVRRLFCQIRRSRGPRPEDVAVPVETEPGEVLQVDFGFAGRFYDASTGVMRNAWVFVAVLGFSRMMFAKIVFDQGTETWLELHREAFAAFGGCVEFVVPDCTKSAVVRAAYGIDGPSELNRSYRELAEHYRLKIDPTPGEAPRMKGKVEAAVKFVQANALRGRDGERFEDVQVALQRWNAEIASTRVHGTTGRRPVDLFEQEERAALRPLPTTAFESVVWKRARVHPDSHVAFQQRLYSVPWQLIHQEVWVRAAGRGVAILHDDRRVASHPRFGPRRSTLEEHLPPDRRELRHRGRLYWEERAERIGPQTLLLVREVFDSDEVLSQLRRVQAIVTYLERYPATRAEATSHRARHLGDRRYQNVKDILTRALDLLPLPAVPRLSRSRGVDPGRSR